MTATPDLRRFDALLFDLDGVLTRTATLHARAWKSMFDGFLERRSAERDEAFEPFDIGHDYLSYVDGRRRYDGVDTFLRSRGIELPWGDPADEAGKPTVCGLGNAENHHFLAVLAQEGVEVYDDAVALLTAAAAAWRPRTAVVSASENCRRILERSNLLESFDALVTGVEAAELELAGKPAPDTFLHAAGLLGVEPGRAVVFEDAVSGVQAGRAGGFGLVVGVDRGGARDGLLAGGAQIVSTDLRELIPRHP